MLTTQTDRDLRQMERAASDDLHLIETLGPSAYDDYTLLDLRNAAVAKIDFLDRSIRLLRIIAAAFLGWLPVMVAAMWFQRSWLVKLGMLGMTAVTVAFLISLVFWVQQSRQRNAADHHLRRISNELWRRQRETTH